MSRFQPSPASPAFFARHGVAQLQGWSDAQLGALGRLTHPMAYHAPSGHYRPIGWDEAIALIADQLRGLGDPGRAEFYAGGTGSNEAAFLYQLFGRCFGSGNFPVGFARGLAGRIGLTAWPGHAFLDRLERRFAFRAPRRAGHDLPLALEALLRGEVQAFIGLGGGPLPGLSDARIQAALSQVDLTVQIATRLTRLHLLPGRRSLLLPALDRTELDLQAGGLQSLTGGDVGFPALAATGYATPASALLRSEPAIVAALAEATLGAWTTVPWRALVADYGLIRDAIESVFPPFRDLASRGRAGLRFDADADWATDRAAPVPGWQPPLPAELVALH